MTSANVPVSATGINGITNATDQINDRNLIKTSTPAPNVELSPLVISLIVVVCLLVIALIVSMFLLQICIIKRRKGRAERSKVSVETQSQRLKECMRSSRSSTEMTPKQLAVSSSSTTPSPSLQSQDEIKSKKQSPADPSIKVISQQQSNQPTLSPSSQSTTNQSTRMDASNPNGLLVCRTFVFSQGNWRPVEEAPDFSFHLESESLPEVSLKSAE